VQSEGYTLSFRIERGGNLMLEDGWINTLVDRTLVESRESFKRITRAACRGSGARALAVSSMAWEDWITHDRSSSNSATFDSSNILIVDLFFPFFLLETKPKKPKNA
jgi:hypothetical protein